MIIKIFINKKIFIKKFNLKAKLILFIYNYILILKENIHININLFFNLIVLK